ncbi:MAG: glycosyltransferase family 4 protein [Candidatus Peribacteraceae bacterium]|nr:glycosyltransferase family 4 protein [Candidatus Peribacteraceae bacterium]
MKKIFSYADFDFEIGAYQRIRKTVALGLDKSKFQTIAFSSNENWPEQVIPIDPNVDGSSIWNKLIPPQSMFNKLHMIKFKSKNLNFMDNIFRFANPEPNFISTETWKPRTNICELMLRSLPVKADIFHSIGRPECVWLRNLLKITNPEIKHVITFYGFFGYGPYLPASKILARDADIVTAVSKKTKDEVEEACGVDCRVIYDGVDTKFYAPKEHNNERLRILYVGGLQERKRPEYVAQMASKFPQCDFIIHGGGGLQKDLRKMAKKVNNLFIDGKFLSFEELRKLYTTSDIFFFPSIHEGFSNVMLEAAACGLPLVCSNASSFPEFIDHEKNGFLANDFEEMETHIRYLIENESVRKEMGRNSRKRAEEFDWDKIIPQYEKLFEEVMAMK